MHLHPDDAAARGLADGDAVRVHNDRGAFLAAVAVDEAARPGLAFTYKAYWARRSRGGPPSTRSPASGTPTWARRRRSTTAGWRSSRCRPAC
ncbi:molybdopterin dinucleotide binding domain-containing protein [Micromonospora sp. BRA006-A]|nr:molybdopterin dinucleotide binding domain-containing protein [Micromonospora sp. BRA006-A]